MPTQRELEEQGARRERGRRLAWIAVGAAIVGTLILLGPQPSPARADRHPDAGTHQLATPATAMQQGVATLSEQVDWTKVEVAGDPSPLSVAVY